MLAFVCVDDKNGMLYNGRRQSRDRTVAERILLHTGTRRLFMSPYSFPLFQAYAADNILVSEHFLSEATMDDACFVENVPLASCLEKLDTIVVFRWNRRYPGDMFLDLTLDAPPWRRVSSIEIHGTSHEKITEEVFVYET